MKSKKISDNVIKRLPRYIRYLDALASFGIMRVSSGEIGEQMGLTASQIRQDFNCFGSFGQQGYGYNVSELRDKLADILGMSGNRTAIIVGTGNLGRAIMKNFDFSMCGVTLEAAFDAFPPAGVIGNVPVYNVSELEKYARENPVDIAILTVPGKVANEMSASISGLVKGIWNFTNVELNSVPSDVVVENVHFSDSLLALNYYMTQKELEDEESAD